VAIARAMRAVELRAARVFTMEESLGGMVGENLLKECFGGRGLLFETRRENRQRVLWMDDGGTPDGRGLRALASRLGG
jgi:hypothetical protein